MAVYITSQEDVKKYRDSSDMNQSSLKHLEQGLESFLDALNKPSEDKSYFKIGSAVDIKLTGNVEDFNNTFYQADTNNISAKEAEIVNNVFQFLLSTHNGEIEAFMDFDLPEFSDLLIETIVEFKYYTNRKIETNLKNILKSGEEYFEILKKSYGKSILTPEEANTVSQIVESLQSNPKTKKYFNKAEQESSVNTDFYYQLPMYFTYKGVKCKALSDLIIVNKDSSGNIISIIPVDLKTTSKSLLDFPNSVKHYGYALQAAFYTEGLKSKFNVSEESIEDFVWIVESTTKIGKPLVFKCSNSLLKIGKEGLPALKANGILIKKKVFGFDNLIDEYLYYQNNGWDEERIVKENPEGIYLDYNGLITNEN